MGYILALTAVFFLELEHCYRCRFCHGACAAGTCLRTLGHCNGDSAAVGLAQDGCRTTGFMVCFSFDTGTGGYRHCYRQYPDLLCRTDGFCRQYRHA